MNIKIHNMKINIFENLNLRHKIIIPLLLVILLLFTTIIIVTVYSLKETFNYHTDKLIEVKTKEVNGSIEQLCNTALYIASISSEMKIVKDAYREYYRTGNLIEASNIIDNQFSKINKIIFESSGYEARIHFHLPPAISFYRCWSKIRGDDIADFRNSILRISKEHTFVKGVETGRGGFAIRGVAPIFSETNEYYGSVEAFFNINVLLEKINNKPDEDLAIFMNTDLLNIASDFLEDTSTNIQSENQIIDDYILVDKTENFQLENIVKSKFNISDNNIFQYNNYKYAVIPIKNISNKVEGIGILQIDISAQQKSMKKIIILELIIFTFLVIIVLLLLSKLSNRFIVNKIIETDLLLQKLSKGELIKKIIVSHKDEISSMQTSLNLLNENITKNTNFALEISKGNLHANYKAISKTDLLGNAMVQMQKVLMNYRENTENILNKLSQSEKNFKNLSNLTFEGILIHDKGIIIDFNLSFANLFGYTHDEIIGKNAIKLLVREECHDIISNNIIKNYALPYEIEGIKKDGSYFPIELEAKNVKDKDDNRTIRVVAVRDITERKKAEKEITKLSIAVEQSANSIIITDIDGNIEYTNPKFSEITGYTAEEALGQNPRILNSGTQPKKYYVKLWQTITKGESWKGEFYNKKKNGEYFWEQVTITPLKNEKKEITNFLAIKEDITARKIAEQELKLQNEEYSALNEEYKSQNEELKLAKEKAEESDQLKTEFIHNMSHEIRTPMNGILGFSSFLNDPNLNEGKRKQFVNIIQNSGNQLLRIIDDILEISRLGTKQVKVIEKEVVLNNFLLQQFSIFEIKAKENKIPLYLKKGLSDKQSSILTDETKLNKILSNLIDNALKYTSEGFIEFGYQLKNTELEIYVKDTGIGIKKENQETIFVRFSQEEKELSKNVGGLGLGLSIAKENAELLGGKITLQSEKGKGSTFIVTIPYKPVFSEKIKNIINNDKKEITEKQNNYIILIVEDEEVNYLYLETLLENLELNLKILHAKNGKEAVEMCKQNSEIDFVLMDMKMPIMNGFEATKLIKEFQPNLPIVAQTAYSSEEEKVQAFSAGCDDFISKPISKETLSDIINKYLIN